jgi:signal transduction histidine kinase
MTPQSKSSFLLLLCWLSLFRAAAHDTLFINRYFEFASVVPVSDWIHDASRQWKPDPIGGEKDTGWQPSDHYFFRIQNPGRYWLRFTIYNQDRIPLYLRLSSSSLEVHRMQLYTGSSGGMNISVVTGSDFPTSQRPLKSADLCFDILAQPQQYYTCYLYLERAATPVQTSFLLDNIAGAAYNSNTRLQVYKTGFVIGMAALYGIISLAVFIFFPQMLHFGYCLYTLSGLGYLIACLGVGMDVLWSEYPYFEVFSAEFFATLLCVGLIMMSRVILQVPHRFFYLDKILLVNILIGILYLFIGLWRYAFPLTVLTYGSIVAGIVSALSLMLITGLCFWNYGYYKERESLWFFTVFGFTILSAFIMVLVEMSIITRTDFINHTMSQWVLLLEATLATIFVANRIKNQLLIRQNRELALQLQRRQELERIARDLHDEVGSTLSSISILGDVTSANLQLELGKRRLATISTRAREVMDTMSDIVWSVNPKNDPLGAIGLRMRTFAVETLETKNVSLNFKMPQALEGLQLPMEQRKDFYLIFKEAINNAAKYAQAQHVWITLQKVNAKICLEIRDDGKGFDIQTVKHGNGLRNMQARAERLNGKLDIHSEINQGTCLTLSFPVTS